MLLLDQRGTGRSTPATRQTLARRGGAKEQAEYLAHFRADSIVRDAELIRRRLLGGDRRWSVLGQSFGGFCTLTYLSIAPEGLDRAFVTGGLAGLHSSAAGVYRAAYPRVVGKNEDHYARFPQDVDAVRRIAGHLAGTPAALPDGGLLTVEAFQALGMLLGTGSGSGTLHYLLEEAWVEGVEGPELSDTFLAGAQAQLSFAQGPLYAVLHESIYGQRSVDPAGTAWAAERVRAEFPEFDARAALESGAPVLFTGEMIYPWVFDTDPALRPLRRPRSCSPPAPTGRTCTTRPCSPPTRCRCSRRCTTTTCTSTPPTRWRPREPCAGCGPGSPTSGSTTASGSAGARYWTG